MTTNIEIAEQIIDNKLKIKELSEDNKVLLEDLKELGEDFEYSSRGVSVSINKAFVSSVKQVKSKTKKEDLE